MVSPAFFKTCSSMEIKISISQVGSSITNQTIISCMSIACPWYSRFSWFELQFADQKPSKQSGDLWGSNMAMDSIHV